MNSGKVRLALPPDCQTLSHFRASLWPAASAEEHAEEIAPILAGKPPSTLPYTIFVAELATGELAGFLEVGLRSHADGCDTRQPVGFLEGWFVSQNHRRQGWGRQLLLAAEDWARGHGCREMASDSWLDDTVSERVHVSLQFTVVDRCVHYRKEL